MGDGWRLRGRKALVTGAHKAEILADPDRFVVRDEEGGETWTFLEEEIARSRLHLRW